MKVLAVLAVLDIHRHLAYHEVQFVPLDLELLGNPVGLVFLEYPLAQMVR